MPNVSDYNDRWNNKWPDSSLYRFVVHTGLQYLSWVNRSIKRAYAAGEIETVEDLIGVVSGKVHWRNVGVKSRLDLATALLRWYKENSCNSE